MLVPLYSLGVLIFLKMLVPNPNFPEVRKPGRLLKIHHDAFPENHSVAVVADWLNANGTMVKKYYFYYNSFKIQNKFTVYDK